MGGWPSAGSFVESEAALAAGFTLWLVTSALTCDPALGEVVGLHVIPHEAEAALVERARRQHGVLTVHQLRAAGLGTHAIERRVSRGWLRRAHRGVYIVGALESDLTAPTAALAAYGRNAILSHRTAAVLWRLLPARPADPVDVTLLNANRRSRPGVRVHYAQAAQTRRRHGLRLTSPAHDPRRPRTHTSSMRPTTRRSSSAWSRTRRSAPSRPEAPRYANSSRTHPG